MPAEVQYRHLVLDAAAAALDRDGRQREAATRNREVLATLVVAGVATFATLVQAAAMVVDLVRR